MSEVVMLDKTSWDKLPVVLTMDQVADVLRVSKPTVYEVAKRPGFPVLRMGRKMVVSKLSLMNWLEQQMRIS